MLWRSVFRRRCRALSWRPDVVCWVISQDVVRDSCGPTWGTGTWKFCGIRPSVCLEHHIVPRAANTVWDALCIDSSPESFQPPALRISWALSGLSCLTLPWCGLILIPHRNPFNSAALHCNNLVADFHTGNLKPCGWDLVDHQCQMKSTLKVGFAYGLILWFTRNGFLCCWFQIIF